MIDRILNFFKNKYFLIALALLVAFIAIYQFLDYQNKLKNDDEFKKLISFNEKVIIEEIEWANDLFKKNKRWPVYNVTNKALEETATDILKIINMRRKNQNKQVR